MVRLMIQRRRNLSKNISILIWLHMENYYHFDASYEILICASDDGEIDDSEET